MQVSLNNITNTPQTPFKSTRHVCGKLIRNIAKTYRASNNKEEKYCKQYLQGVKNVCCATKGDVLNAQSSLNDLEHTFIYNTGNFNPKKLKSKKTFSVYF